MVAKPKDCKYGCGTIITWNDVNRYFMGPDGQKHDCRDWPGVGNNSGGGQAIGNQGSNPVASPSNFNNPSGGGVYQTAPPSSDTLIALQAKKTWENYFKMLEPLTANSAAIVSAIEETNKHLMELGNKIKSLEETMTVSKIRSNGTKPKEKEIENV